VVPKSLPGVTVNYMLSQRERLTIYLEHTEMTPNNNQAKNTIRPLVVGRKNWLFAGTPKGARASCGSLQPDRDGQGKWIGTVPVWYLRYLFEKLPFARSTENYQALLPVRLGTEDVALKNIASGVYWAVTDHGYGDRKPVSSRGVSTSF
jgi:transposase